MAKAYKSKYKKIYSDDYDHTKNATYINLLSTLENIKKMEYRNRSTELEIKIDLAISQVKEVKEEVKEVKEEVKEVKEEVKETVEVVEYIGSDLTQLYKSVEMNSIGYTEALNVLTEKLNNSTNEVKFQQTIEEPTKNPSSIICYNKKSQPIDCKQEIKLVDYININIDEKSHDLFWEWNYKGSIRINKIDETTLNISCEEGTRFDSTEGVQYVVEGYEAAVAGKTPEYYAMCERIKPFF